jgi:hypothetical protein
MKFISRFRRWLDHRHPHGITAAQFERMMMLQASRRRLPYQER